MQARLGGRWLVQQGRRARKGTPLGLVTQVGAQLLLPGALRADGPGLAARVLRSAVGLGRWRIIRALETAEGGPTAETAHAVRHLVASGLWITTHNLVMS